MTQPQFDLEFENDVLAECLRNPEYTKLAVSMLGPHQFQTEQHGWIWEQVQDCWATNNELLTPRTILARVRRNRKFKDDDEREALFTLATDLFQRKPDAVRTALSELERFVRYVQLQTAMEDAIKALEKGEIDQAWDTFRSATMRDASPKGFTVTDWYDEFVERLAKQKHKRDHPELYPCVPTGIKGIDKVMDGLRPTELGMVMATTGRGKSVFAVHLGYHGALKLPSNHVVVDFRFEMTADEVNMRYDSRFTRLLHRKFKLFDFTGKEITDILKQHQRMKAKLANKLKVISTPINSATLDMCRRAVDEIAQKHQIGLLIFDSGDHIKPTRQYKDKRFETTDVYWNLKAWATEDELPIWATTQAGKQAAQRLAKAEDASEAYDKSRIANAIITLNKPSTRSRATPKVDIDDDDDDDDDKKDTGVTAVTSADLVALLTKYRDGESDIVVPLEADLARMMIKDRD